MRPGFFSPFRLDRHFSKRFKNRNLRVLHHHTRQLRNLEPELVWGYQHVCMKGSSWLRGTDEGGSRPTQGKLEGKKKPGRSRGICELREMKRDWWWWGNVKSIKLEWGKLGRRKLFFFKSNPTFCTYFTEFFNFIFSFNTGSAEKSP